jgi:hypothetical protein
MPGRRSGAERGAVLLVRFDHERSRADVLRAVAASGDMWKEHPPETPDDDFIREPVESMELVASLLDDEERLLVSFAFPAEAFSYYDHHHDDVRERVRGGVVHGHEDVRSLHLSLPEGVRWLVFARRRVVEHAGERSVETRRYQPRFRIGGKPREDLPRGAMQLTLARRPRPGPSGAKRAVGGVLGRPLAVGGDGDSTTSFNVVYLGDGFDRSEQKVLETTARGLAAGLLAMPPYDRFRKNLTFTLVPATSPASGVSNCPFKGTSKKTYFGVEGFWGGVDTAGFFGTAHIDRVHEAVETALPHERVHLIVLLVNTAMYGGRADPHQRLVYAAIQYPGKNLVGFVAHESAHAYAQLADEYISETAAPKRIPYANVCSEKELYEGKTRWKRVAYSHELHADGTFRSIHRLGDPVTPCTGRPDMPPGLGALLGAYWGAGYLDTRAPDLLSSSVYDDPRGAAFYRPMARCTMRWLSEPFCRVCERTQRDAIRKAIRQGKDIELRVRSTR